MYLSKKFNKIFSTRKWMSVLSFLVIISLNAVCANEGSLSRLKIDIFRKAVSQSELTNVGRSLSKQGKQAICHLSDKKIKVIWIDEKVLDKIEESTVHEALQKGLKDKELVCNFTDLKSYSMLLDGIVSYPKKGQVVFYDAKD